MQIQDPILNLHKNRAGGVLTLMAGNGEISNLRQIFQSSIVWIGEAYMRRRIPADYVQFLSNIPADCVINACLSIKNEWSSTKTWFWGAKGFNKMPNFPKFILAAWRFRGTIPL